MLDIAITMFEISIVFILFFIIAEAGGSNASMAVEPAQRGASSAAGCMGKSAGQTVGKSGSWAPKAGNKAMGAIKNRWSNKIKGK